MNRHPYIGELVIHKQVGPETVYEVLGPHPTEPRSVMIKYFSGKSCWVRPRGDWWTTPIENLTSKLPESMTYPEGV